ncbi:TetR/AcrR family transcriptional regulator [Paenibacillus sp. NPDC058174]|uniref:TetR/AcrR family transcriptional regulator n=1 Tax=Paenibacillus sp. NPDC058174 TaxID=3346366 RepID=UPI0036DA935A
METKTKIDRRTLRTKEAIHKAFQDLFTEKDFDRITINEIADRANVNRGTIYLHYTDKHDLFYNCVADLLDKMILSCSFSKMTQTKITDPVEATEALEALFVYIEQNFQFFSSMLSYQKTSFRDCVLKVIMAAIQKQMDMQGINQKMDKELIIQFSASAFVGTIEWWIRNNLQHPPHYMAEQVYNLFERNQVFASRSLPEH